MKNIGIDRRCFGPVFPPVRQEFIECRRFEHRARHNVCADLGAFLDDADAEFRTGIARELREPYRCRESAWTGTDDDHVEVH